MPSTNSSKQSSLAAYDMAPKKSTPRYLDTIESEREDGRFLIANTYPAFVASELGDSLLREESFTARSMGSGCISSQNYT